ncbi:MAG: iron-sulfur cluster-binding protein, partial [Gammaproteobacteria bacterium]|nr:iron-sulfur cluster-binding protein [Gammaproteobacteria bacterium]
MPVTRRVNKDFPSPELPFHYRRQPRSGNEINGLGERAFRRAVQVFHGSGARELQWRKLEL